jgi:hypothetical protein
MRKWEEGGKTFFVRFDSVREMADACERDPRLEENNEEFTGVRSHAEAYKLAREGWAAELDDTLNVAESAVSKVEKEMAFPTFVAEHDVSGCEVDVARFLDGTPENMIDYPLREIVRAGKVITLCASVCYSAAIDKDVIAKRGQAAAALALALSKLGYSLEIYADFSTREKMTPDDFTRRASVRALVKGAQDAMDPEAIAYALCHPSMLRVLAFSAMKKMPSDYCWFGLGVPNDPIEDLPEGTLYTPCVISSKNVPDADEQLVEWLRQLEIITD